MSSSLLIILLVVVWLFVLAPMLIRSRNPIRRTGDALAQTRTLYSGGSGRLVPSRGRASGDPVRVESEETLFGLPSGSGATDAELLDTDTWGHLLEQTLRREAAGRRGEAVRRVMEERRNPGTGHPGSGGTASGDDTSPEEVTTEIPAVVVADRSGTAVSAGVGATHVATDGAAVVGQVDETRRPNVVDGELVETPAGERTSSRATTSSRGSRPSTASGGITTRPAHGPASTPSSGVTPAPGPPCPPPSRWTAGSADS